MKRLISFSITVFTCFCLLIATERKAWAYIDPGSGLLALQAAASVMAGFGYFLRRRIRRLFGKKDEKEAEIALVESEQTNTHKAA